MDSSGSIFHTAGLPGCCSLGYFPIGSQGVGVDFAAILAGLDLLGRGSGSGRNAFYSDRSGRTNPGQAGLIVEAAWFSFVRVQGQAQDGSICEPTEQPGEEASDLFAGLSSGQRYDMRQEASHLSTELVVRAYYGKDNRRGAKRPAYPRRQPQAKRPKAGPTLRPQAPQSSSLRDGPFQGHWSYVAREVGDHPMAHFLAEEGIAPVGVEGVAKGYETFQRVEKPVGTYLFHHWKT